MEFLNNTLGIIASILTLVGIVGGAICYFIKINNKKINNVKGSGFASDNVNDAQNVSESILKTGNGGLNVVGNHNTFNLRTQQNTSQENSNTQATKDTYQILFIDDEDFMVIKMLRKQGWKHIKRRNDIANPDDIDVRNANIVFVDIKGVGIDGGFSNEGIGLAAAIKRKYPQKGVVLYSGTLEHNIFDNDIKLVDDQLPKNADPIQFSNMIEQYGNVKY